MMAEPVKWRVALVYSSSRPGLAIPWLVEPEKEKRVEQHHSFIKWLSPWIEGECRADQDRADAERLRLQLKAATFMVNIAYHAFEKLKSENHFMPHAEVDWWFELHSKACEWLYANNVVGISFDNEAAIDAAIIAARAAQKESEKEKQNG